MERRFSGGRLDAEAQRGDSPGLELVVLAHVAPDALERQLVFDVEPADGRLVRAPVVDHGCLSFWCSRPRCSVVGEVVGMTLVVSRLAPG